jgi:hypothetical protein
VGDHLRIAFSASREMAGIQREFRKLVAGSFKQPVPLAGRIGMTIDPQPATGSQELAHLAGLGRIPVLLRFCHHHPPARWEYLAGVAEGLRRSGHAVSVALVQDRRAVLRPESWIHFAGTVLDMVGPSVAWVEAGHAVNRVKWGVWTRREYRRLMEGLSAVAQKHPGVRWVGPAVNDFEYMPVIDNLKQSPLSYWGLSLHLYGVRRSRRSTALPRCRNLPWPARLRIARRTAATGSSFPRSTGRCSAWGCIRRWVRRMSRRVHAITIPACRRISMRITCCAIS